jgi:hypothetical protein
MVSRGSLSDPVERSGVLALLGTGSGALGG